MRRQIYLLANALTYLLTYVLTHLLTYSLTHSLTHLLAQDAGQRGAESRGRLFRRLGRRHINPRASWDVRADIRTRQHSSPTTHLPSLMSCSP